MAEIEPPTFSLGFDLDLNFDAETESVVPQPSPSLPPSCRALPEEHDEDKDFAASLVIDSQEERQNEEDELEATPVSGPAEAPRILKRPRRGPATVEQRAKLGPELGSAPSENDIEDFSSDGDDFFADMLPSRQHNSVCSSSSKVTLRGSGVLTGQSSGQSSVAKQKGMPLKTPASSSLETSHSGLVFPKLTTSPLRRFQLISSDEEPTPSGNNVNRKPENVGSRSGKEMEDLWKDFSPLQNVRIGTPALDEFCNEYFQSVTNKNAAANRRETQEHNLVCNRLTHFFPLGVVRARRNLPPSESVIDYMSQFGGTPQNKGTGGSNLEKGSTSKLRKRARKSDANAAASQGWVDPRTSASLRKDAGQRRVQASGQATAAGHWFTSSEGLKVYVSRNGQELTGQTAYRHFQKG
ncbi:unnamed protein product [Linum tenue]|uniref:Uncharacterized protein n=1 Tax=Linum tenue TaxID=586396 RepID=A0AAV0JUN7_9ROSI|nr:unnamed protein product [Linum tenue]